MTNTTRSAMASRASEIVQHLRANGFDADGAVNRQVLNLAEEVGEFVGAYRRWAGQARRSGPLEDVHAELADVVITAYVTAEELGFDIDAAIAAKLDVVFSRGWREPAERPVAVEAEGGRYYARWVAGGESFAARCNCGWSGPERPTQPEAMSDLTGHEAH
jgi:hypothetical protein